MTLPNFLILGAAKSGTSALYKTLAQHPEIYLSPSKEPRFFAFAGEAPRFGGPQRNDYTDQPTVTTWSEYEALFAQAGEAAAIGEASTVYLYYPGERPAERIRRWLPEAKLIAILRHPAERAFSNYTHCVRLDWEPLADFEQAWNDEPRRIRENWSYFLRYRQNGCYATQLQHYMVRFPFTQLRIYLYEDWCNRRDETFADILRFLEVDHRFRPAQYLRSNVSLMPRHRRLHRLFNHSRLAQGLSRGSPFLRRATIGLVNRLNLYRPTLSPDLRRVLTQAYRPEILRLQDLLGRDLSSWLE